GGSHGREEATGRGVAIVMNEYASHKGQSLAGKTVAIQGFGNVGSHAAAILHEMGMKVVAVSDVKGGIYHAAGLPIDKVLLHSKQTGSVVGFGEADAITNEDLLAMDCEYLVPAAVGGAIHQGNAHLVRAKV